jgi:hypothetical protein
LEAHHYRGTYEFPSLGECRTTFAQLTGTNPQWPQPEEGQQEDVWDVGPIEVL